MKKKITAIALVVMLLAVSVLGATLAYFTDTDKETNVFTSGNVAIDLTENFTQESKLMPVTGSAQNGTLENGVTKEVFVTNTGSEDAFVRVHIAIPAILDNGAETFDAGKNVLHFNYKADSIGEGKWDWSNSTGAPYEGKWNYYETKIDGIDYNVYVVTYEKALKSGDKTVDAIHQVYLDSKVSSSDMEQLNATLGTKWNMYVVAEGVQTAGFDDAYAALNTAFGAPGSYAVAFK